VISERACSDVGTSVTVDISNVMPGKFVPLALPTSGANCSIARHVPTSTVWAIQVLQLAALGESLGEDRYGQLRTQERKHLQSIHLRFEAVF
jgi:hypothetical protein